MHVPFSYLDRQFSDVEDYLDDIRRLVEAGDFTLGHAVAEFEERFARLCGTRHAVGVGNGTDALMLPLKLLGIGPGDEVITAANTFIATVGAIAMTGARPVFVDSDDGFVIDATKIAAAVTPRTKAIVPVHYTGNVADMPTVMKIARAHNLTVIGDACQAIGAELDGQPIATFGLTAAYSLHPLKNLNVWGDGGVVVTDSDELAEQLRLYRNHGLLNRDEAAMFGHNSRLDTLQAVVGNRLIGQVEEITESRIRIAGRYDEAFADLAPEIRVPPRRPGVQHVFHLYVLRANRRDALLAHLQQNGIEAKIHYPIPVHLQRAAEPLGYQRGDFPVTEADSETVITLPAHQHLSDDEIEYTIQQVRSFCET